MIPKGLRNLLNRLIEQFNPASIEVGQEAQDLADVFIFKKIVPLGKREDALHIAAATIKELDAVITWNYKHLANLRRSELFHVASLEKGYLKKVEIITPLEVSYG